jgi:hypothetical protein
MEKSTYVNVNSSFSFPSFLQPKMSNCSNKKWMNNNVLADPNKEKKSIFIVTWIVEQTKSFEGGLPTKKGMTSTQLINSYVVYLPTYLLRTRQWKQREKNDRWLSSKKVIAKKKIIQTNILFRTRFKMILNAQKCGDNFGAAYVTMSKSLLPKVERSKKIENVESIWPLVTVPPQS